MSTGIEARYLMIEWQSEQIARTIQCAPVPLEINSCPEGGFALEATIFNDFHPWLGIRLGAESEDAVPTLVAAAGRETAMLRVEDPSGGKCWWVQSSGWDSSTKRHLSELHRSPGTYKIRIGDAVLRLENRLSNFGRADIQAYIDDFRGDLLWMVMNDDAGATARGSGADGGAELTSALEELRAASQRVLTSPAVTIREDQAPQPIAKVRPGPATFRDHARNPAARMLTGRVFRESADTAENRYLRYMIAVSKNVESLYALTASSQLSFLERLALQENERAKRNREMDMRLVDPAVFDQQTKEIERKLEALACFREVSKEDTAKVRQFPIRLGKAYYLPSSFYYERQDEAKDSADNDVDYRVIVMPKGMFDLVLGSKHFCKDFTIEGNVMSKIEETQSNKRFRKLDIVSVRAIKPQTDVLLRREKKRQQLEKNEWRVGISDAERRELRREAETAQQRADRALARQQRIASSVESMQRARERLAEVDVGLAALGVGESSIFPMGMRYVSNPDYAACFSAFKTVCDVVERGGLDLSRLEEVSNIGILHVSDIYEKWCMLKIIMLLVQDFRFVPETGWKERLVAVSLSLASSIRFDFSRDDLALNAVLTCQAEMPTGRRPDFVLEIFAKDAEESHHPDHSKSVGGSIVMDAKFRSGWKANGPRPVLDELVQAKAYGTASASGKVFILQPCEATVHPPASPLDWGAHCDYGSAQSHQQGWIQTGVGSSGVSSTQHLKRLLVMVLQSVFPEPKKTSGETGEAAHVSRSFCIGCGELHVSSSIRTKFTKSGKIRWFLDCRSCGVWTERNHCYNCKEPLFKNGTMWTYHGTVADQVTNVICHKCGSYFDPDDPTY